MIEIMISLALFSSYTVCLKLNDKPLDSQMAPSHDSQMGASQEAGANINRQVLPLAPVAFVHIPKTGTSFLSALVHHPDVCPMLPADAATKYISTLGRNTLHKFFSKYPKAKYCPGFAKDYHTPPGHQGIGSLYNEHKGHVLAFFREPRSRVISAFNYNPRRRHLWPYAEQPTNISQYANGVKGCQVRMLTHESHSAASRKENTCGGGVGLKEGQKPAPVSKEQIQIAIDRVNEMNFVGITSEFDFSICLFHAVYGGTCSDHDFVPLVHNVPKVDTNEIAKQVAILKDYKDEIDTPLYEAVEKRFWTLMQKNNLNRGACEKLCQNATQTKPFSVEAKGLQFEKAIDFRFSWPGRKYAIADEEDEDDEEDEGP
eukprot:gnl/MRDRNA2_/MRDRNA2_83536_c0_seq2.p1 gnl/MRDRNA2_/MRDRNA2_83536_c0~~gnl/MRDRNA2_/MRDRNA2_83536_c0_seq2.p1  ORF type:complete len:372 (-),score=52.67 gnl/MRDRNA2_/MRDRNA2_83536_c0_seq2:310-1425(-)